MTRRTASTLLLLAMLTLALVALQCPLFDCVGCAGDEAVAKQFSPLWVPTGGTVVAALDVPAVWVRQTLLVVAAPALAPDLHERSCRLLI